jgi:M6 family metalloprotease-like protein
MKRRICICALTAAFVICLAMFFYTESTFAVSACPGYHQLTQPDGTSFKCRIVGDEYFHYYVNGSGKVIQKEPQTKVWKQVAYSSGKMSLGARAEKKSSVSSPLRSSSLAKTSFQKAYNRLAGTGTSVVDTADSDRLLTVSSLKRTNSSPLYTEASGTDTAIPLLTIVIGFSNIDYSNDYNWGSIIFSGDKSIGSYYKKVSAGKFDFVPCQETSAYNTGGNTNTHDAAGDGVVHVKLDLTHDDWSSLNNESFISAFTAAIKAVDSYVDFSAYDQNDDGYISAKELSVLFVVAGNEAAYGGSSEVPSIWAHQWSIPDDVSVDGTFVSHYIAMGETIADDSQSTNNQIGVVAHELGHILGLPDLYDVDYSSSGEWYDYSVNSTSIMSVGSWGYDPTTSSLPGSSPAYMDPYCRMSLGFVDPVTISSTGTVNVTLNSTDSTAGYNCYRLNTDDPDEFFLLENRQYEGFDVGLKSMYYNNSANEAYNTGGGLLLWHIDKGIVDQYGDVNSVNTVGHRPGVMPAYFESSGLPLLYYPFLNSYATGRYSGYSFNTMLYNDDLRADRTSSGITIAAPAATGQSITADITMGIAAPYILSPSAGTGTITFSWSAVSKATGYTIYRCDPGTDYFVQKTEITGATSYTDNSVEPGRHYKYRIVAHDSTAVSSQSNTIDAVTKVAVPTGLAVTSASTSFVSLSWAPVSGAERYDIYRAASAGGTYSQIGTATDPAFSDSGLLPGTKYYYKIIAVGESASSSYSAAISTTTRISAPAGLKASTSGTSSIKLSWSAVTGARGYYIYRATSAAGTYSRTGTTSAAAYTSSGLSANKKYYYKVRAYGPAASSSYSSTVSAVTNASLSFSLTKSSRSTIKVSWSGKSGVTRYRVYMKDGSSGSYSLKYSGSRSSRSCYIKSLKAGHTYYFRMRYAKTVSGKTVWSNYTVTKYKKI